MGNYFQIQIEKQKEHDIRLIQTGIAYVFANANRLSNVKTNIKLNDANKHVEDLKNALLAYALCMVQKQDPKFQPSFNMNYAAMDGSELPMFSGCDVSNACFSYFSDIAIIQEKQKAIQKYLDKNLASKEQVEAFFDKFIDNGFVDLTLNLSFEDSKS